MRQCVKCGNDMSQGYVYDGSDTYCSDECLSTKVSPETWEILYEEDPSSFYWTVWNDDDGPSSSDDGMEKHKGEVFDSFDNTTIDDMEDLEEEEEEDIDDFCPDLDEYGDIDTGRDPRGDYLESDFT